MSEQRLLPDAEQQRLTMLSSALGEKATAFHQAKQEYDEATEGMRSFLEQHVGSQVAVRGYANFMGIHNDVRNRWTYVPVGPIGSSWEDRKFAPGEYTVCGVDESGGNAYLSVPGREDSRRMQVPLWSIRAVTPEEIQADKAEKERAALQAEQVAIEA